MSLLDRFLTFLLYALGVALVAGFVHILVILLMPHVAPHDGFARLIPRSESGKTGDLILLQRPLPGHQTTPFSDPAVAQGFCLFDLDKGPLYVHGNLTAGGLVTLSFRTKSGRIFYAMTDKATQHGAVDIRVLTAAQREALEGDDDDQEPLQELRLVAPEKVGFVLISAFVPFPSAWEQSEEQIKSLTCSVEPLEEADNDAAPAPKSPGQRPVSPGPQASHSPAN
jgi:uncharacterized membrane protein